MFTQIQRRTPFLEILLGPHGVDRYTELVDPMWTSELRATVVGVRRSTPGSVTLGCHIHGSMRGHLFVATTPWVAVTDEQGRARLAGLPDGNAEMRLWHPDQFTGQTTQTLILSGQAQASAQLSFNPSRRPAPRPKGEYEF